ncbi:hypothetical protein EON62_04255 [archaeon]|nr:MAG: hypothetical protein EON62_04255 [archaeon]
MQALVDWCLPAASIGIMPLIFPLPEQPALMFGLCAQYAWHYGVRAVTGARYGAQERMTTSYHAAGMLVVVLYYALPLAAPHLPFLPLLCVSVYCALGVMCGVVHAMLLVSNTVPACDV